MRTIFFVILMCVSLLARAQTPSWVCQGEQYVAIPYRYDTGEIRSSFASKSEQTFLFNENGFQLLGSQNLFLPISECEFQIDGTPHCKFESRTFDIFPEGVFVLHYRSVDVERKIANNQMIMGKCSRI